MRYIHSNIQRTYHNLSNYDNDFPIPNFISYYDNVILSRPLITAILTHSSGLMDHTSSGT